MSEQITTTVEDEFKYLISNKATRDVDLRNALEARQQSLNILSDFFRMNLGSTLPLKAKAEKRGVKKGADWFFDEIDEADIELPAAEYRIIAHFNTNDSGGKIVIARLGQEMDSQFIVPVEEIRFARQDEISTTASQFFASSPNEGTISGDLRPSSWNI